MEQLDQCENLSYIKPHGAFYIMVDVSKTGFNGQEFADKLLDYGVAVVPASGFGKGLNNFIRISFASSKENIEEACGKVLLYTSTPSIRIITTVLKSAPDKQTKHTDKPDYSNSYGITRGVEYYKKGGASK